VKVVEVPPGPPVLMPIVAEIYGPDEAGRARVARRVRAALESTPGVVGVDDTMGESSAREIVRVDQGRAAVLGVSRRDAIGALQIGLAGTHVASIHEGQAKFGVPVRVMLPVEEERSLESAMKLTMRGADGALVPLAEMVRRREGERERALHRKDLLPVVNVIADEAGHYDSPLYGLFAARPTIASKAGSDGAIAERFVSAPDDPYRGYTLKWDGEWQATYDIFRDMGVAYAVGLVLIYILVVAQFRSYVVPLVIMAPIPLTVIGVMPGHALLGAHFTATSMIGMIALAGIIVRNSILLVDFVNRRLSEGIALEEAILQSAAARAKPIALTAVAAMTGAAFILDDPIFNGLAVSLVFGIFVATLLTLVVIPVLYYRLLVASLHGRPSIPADPARSNS
jgi:multidrug efflux pump subunit AcrB